MTTYGNTEPMAAPSRFYPCDADGFPLWLTPCTEEESRQYSPHHLMPTATYRLAWLSRHGTPARWYVIPR